MTIRRFLPAFLPSVADVLAAPGRGARLAAPGRWAHPRRILPAFLPAIASTPRRAAISATLIAGVAAGPLAGHTVTSTGTPTANPVVAAVTRTTVPSAEAPVVTPDDGARVAAPNPVGPGAMAVAPKPVVPGVPTTPAPSASTGSPTPAAPASPAAPVAPAASSTADLLPNGAPSVQSYIGLDADQVNNARAIIKATKEVNLPPRAAVIAVATSLQETKLVNYGDLGGLNDHDSLGLFQQRPSTGWGTPDQVTNPDHASKAFLSVLVQIPGWQTIPLTDAAQAVQVSAFGDRYAQWEQEAADLVHDNYNLS